LGGCAAIRKNDKNYGRPFCNISKILSWNFSPSPKYAEKGHYDTASGERGRVRGTKVVFSFSYPVHLQRIVIPAKAGIQKSKLDAPGLKIAGAGLSGPA
jgi:hypothetical protein